MMTRRHCYLTALGVLFTCTFQGVHAFLYRASQHRRCAVSVAGESLKQQQQAEAIENLKRQSTETFRTPPMHVYIEYTDAFGVVYNGNYLKFFDRALHRMTEDDGDWSIVGMGEQKFKQSPALGGTFVVEGVRKELHEEYEIWDMDMKSVDDDSLVFNSVTGIRIAKSIDRLIQLPTNVGPFDIPQGGFLAKDTFHAYRDEFEPHLQNAMPLRNVLNLFERSRSNYLGGPNVLREMQTQEGIIFVVTHIEDAWLIDEGATCGPGDEVVVETAFVARRKGMVLDCLQSLKRGASRLAQAKVRVMVLNATTMRPTNNLPESLKTTLKL